MKYELVKNNPVAKFWYKGTHTHPVRRTVLVVRTTPKLVIGYELREGRDVRNLKNAPIKSYRKDKIALARQLRPGNKLRSEDESASTYRRENLVEMLENGV